MLDVPRGNEKLEYVRSILAGYKCLQTFSKQKFSVRDIWHNLIDTITLTIAYILELMQHFWFRRCGMVCIRDTIFVS